MRLEPLLWLKQSRVGELVDFGSFADEEAASGFHLPIDGVFADLEGGRGCVRPTDDFLGASALARVRIYDDWTKDIKEPPRVRILVAPIGPEL